MIDLQAFAKEVHENAVAHGWYDKGERSEAEIFANIHSEWSEAFDAYAHGEPNYYHVCGDPATKGDICEKSDECYSRKIGWDGDYCFMRNKKPEGAAVELIDGAIRILDYVGYLMEKGISVNLDMPNRFSEDSKDSIRERDFCANICGLHNFTTYALEDECVGRLGRGLGLLVSYAFTMVEIMNLDPEEIMLEKHEYNKSRSYRHGGKVV